jgi:signal transduction histidine kinase
MEQSGAWRTHSPGVISAAIRIKAGADLITHLQYVTELENARVAKLLHDELGACIVAAIMDIAWVEDHMEADRTDSLLKLARARHALRTAIDMKRKLIDELRPTLLDDVGLFAALSWQLKKTWGGARFSSTEKYPPAELRLRPDVLIGMFRVAQEALQIGLEHQLVNSASLTVTVRRNRLFMRFIDDGVPAIPMGLPCSANVLTSMRNRLRVLGGRVQITEHAGGGTMLLATVPLAAPLAA